MLGQPTKAILPKDAVAREPTKRRAQGGDVKLAAVHSAFGLDCGTSTRRKRGSDVPPRTRSRSGRRTYPRRILITRECAPSSERIMGAIVRNLPAEPWEKGIGPGIVDKKIMGPNDSNFMLMGLAKMEPGVKSPPHRHRYTQIFYF